LVLNEIAPDSPEIHDKLCTLNRDLEISEQELSTFIGKQPQSNCETDEKFERTTINGRGFGVLGKYLVSKQRCA